MKTFLNTIIVTMTLICIGLGIYWVLRLYSEKEITTNELTKIKRQNDSLIFNIKQRNKVIDSIDNFNKKILSRNDSLNKKLLNISIVAQTYKKQHEKSIDYINSLSDSDITKLFTDKFK